MSIAQALEQAGDRISEGLAYVRRCCLDGAKVDTARLDLHQQAIADLSLSTAEIEAARVLQDYAASRGEIERSLADTFAAEALTLMYQRLQRSPADFGMDSVNMPPGTSALCARHLRHDALASVGSSVVDADGFIGERGLGEEKALMANAFRQFSDDVVVPLAEGIHREDRMIPAAILDGLRDLGCFGLSVPERFGGLLPDDGEDSLGMIVVTEELSRASLGAAGSLITRPEILARALIEGGTEEQKASWLPRIAQGQPLPAIAITEPDYGSDVASVQLKAIPDGDGWRLSGSKMWCTFAGKAGVLLTLARTDPDSSNHRGLSLFLVEKPEFDEHEFTVSQPGGGRLTGTAIATVGYRGMHSFQLFFDNFFVPSANLIGEGQGLGRGFYFTMRGFSGGRIQTAARACGVMQAAFDAALSYAGERKVFGKPVASYQLSRIKLARMAAYLLASRQYTYHVGRMMDEGAGQVDASLVKLFACKASEWITREAMQIHGGLGYAEESAVSRYWLDSRVLSIFEGTEETLALKVVGRALVEAA